MPNTRGFVHRGSKCMSEDARPNDFSVHVCVFRLFALCLFINRQRAVVFLYLCDLACVYREALSWALCAIEDTMPGMKNETSVCFFFLISEVGGRRSEGRRRRFSLVFFVVVLSMNKFLRIPPNNGQLNPTQREASPLLRDHDSASLPSP